MAFTLCFPLRGQRSEFRASGVAAFPETSSAKARMPPRSDPPSLGPPGLLWETSSEGRGGQSEGLHK